MDNTTPINIRENTPRHIKQEYYYIVVGLIVLAVIVFFAFKRGGFAGPALVSAAMTRTIDTKGNPIGKTATFSSKNDKIIYAVLTVKNATLKTKVAYIRTYNGKYVDSKVIFPANAGLANVAFSFEKGIGDYPRGNYVITGYINGKKVVALPYTFN